MWEADESRATGYLLGGRIGNDIGIGYSASNYPDSGYCYGTIRVTARFFNLYKTGDLRRDWAIAPFSYNSTTGKRAAYTSSQIYNRNAAKWRRTYETFLPKDKNFTIINFPLLRYADVLLMLAEAENQVNGPTQTAYDAINQVRRRGYGKPLNLTDPVADLTPGLDKQRFQLAIQDERSRELCFETLRRPDLIRWGIFVSTMNAVGAEIKANGGSYAYGSLAGLSVTQRHLLFPIPSGEMSVNKAVTQNPGW
jgi:hypothetical protein